MSAITDPLSRTSSCHDFSSTICTLEVGSEASVLTAHGSLLSAHSKFFKAALNTAWREGKEMRIKLPDDYLTVLRVYIHYIYTQDLPILETPEFMHRKDFENQLVYLILADLYVFGEKIQDFRFKNRVIDAFLLRMTKPDTSGSKWYPVTTAVDKIYSGTTSGSPARQLMVDVHTSRKCPN